MIRTHNQRDIMGQNNTILKDGDSPEILLDLLKDPGVTVSYLKNIFILEEIFKLLPANNLALTKEIENLYNDLLIPHHEIAAELVRQEQESTVFKGEFFDFLRKLTDESQPRSELQGSVINLLKSINNLLIKDDILDAVANSLTYLSKSLQPSQSLAEKLEMLAQRFRQEEEPGRFAALKGETLAILKEVEDSILYSPKLQKMVSITVYNLSRFHEGMDYFHEAAAGLWQKLTGENRLLFANYIDSLMKFFREQAGGKGPGGETAAAAGGQSGQIAQPAPGGQAASAGESAPSGTAAGAEAGGERPAAEAAGAAGSQAGTAIAAAAEGAEALIPGAAAGETAAGAGPAAGKPAPETLAWEAATGAMAQAGAPAAGSSSKVMDALIEMIRAQSAADEAGKGETGQVDKIIHSLLSSPCNFTPLLHFVVPAFWEDVKAFAEIWVNPYDDEQGAQGVAAGRYIHLLLVMDVEVLGRFEVELRVRDQVVDLSLHCPSGQESRFAGMLAELPARLRRMDLGYRLGSLEVQTLEHPRSLMEVFKTLPYKRMGVDVKI